MAELSSLLFVDTDELGRPTGLIASEETDTFASALMPQDVKDTVEIVKVSDVSGSYPAWNTVSGVSGLAPYSATLTALPGDFEDLEASVGYVSSVVDTIDPAAINSVSATVLNSSGNWESTYSYIESASGNISSASSLVIGADSGLSSLETSVGEISTVVETIDPDAINGVSGTVYNNSGTWNDASSVSGFNGVSSVVYDNSSTWNGASGVSAIDDVSGTVYNNSGTWNDASSVSGFDGVSSVVYNNSGTWNDASGVSAIDDVSGTVYNNSGTWNDASSVSGFDDVSSTVYNNSGTWNDASGVSAIDDVSGTVYNNSGTWNDASGVSAIDDVSSTVYNNSGTWNDASSVSGFNDISAIVSDGSGVLSSLSGSIPGNENGPDVPIFSALSAIADRIRVVDTITGEDAASGQTIYLSGASRITTRANTAVADLTFGPGNQEVAVLKLQNSLGGVAYLSGTGGAGLMSPAGGDIWMAEEALGGATQTSSLRGLYQKTSDSSGNWDATYTYVDSASGNIDNVSGHVSDTSSDIVSVSSYVSDTSSDVVDVSNYVSDTSSDVVSVSSYVSDTSSDVVTVSGLVIDGSTILSALSGNNESFNSSRSKASGLSALEQRLTIGNAAGTENLEGGTFLLLSGAAGIATKASTATFIANDATKGIQIGSANLNIVHPSIKYGPTGSLSSLIPIIADLASVSGTGGGGGGGLSSIASAILVSDGSAVDVNIGGTPENNTILVLDTENERFNYEKVAFQVVGDLITPLTENLGFDFGGGTSRNFVTSGATKTIMEFDDKSRVALGRNSVPLEISALGESDVRLEDDGTNGAFVYIKGSDAAASLVHLANVDLSADADSQIDIDTDITLGSAAHLYGNMLGAIHIACKNTQGTDVSGGTPVYIKGNVGGSNKIEIGVASASVASSMPAVGILSEDLANNAEGYVDAFGIASKLNTSSFASGDTLYVAPTGGLTNTRPSAATDLVQNIGIVELSDASNGKVIVLGPGRTNDVPNSFTIKSNYTIDDGDNGHLFYVDLEDSGKKSQMLMNPTVPSILVQANDTGGGNVTAFTVGSTNLNLQFTGTSDLRVNNDSGTSGQVLTSNGTGNAPTWKYPGWRWSFADFHTWQNTSNSPWVGTVVNSGNSTGVINTNLFTQEGQGWVVIRSSATANSGFRWDTQSQSTQINPGVVFRAIFNTKESVATDSDRQAWFGWKDGTLNNASPGNGAFFHLSGFDLIPKMVRNTTQTDTGTAETLSADTTYMIEIRAVADNALDFELFSAPTGSTIGSSIQTWSLSVTSPFNQNSQLRAGMSATNTAGGNGNELIALDYMGMGYV